MRTIEMYRKTPFCRAGRTAGPAAWGGRGVRFLAGAAALTVAVIATTAAAPAGVAQHAVPGGASATPPPVWIHIAAGGNHTCGIRTGNTLWCWGRSAAGELGTGQTTDQSQPQQITHPTAGWTSVTAGEEHTCALRNDGTLWCWGNNSSGQAGIGTTTDVARPHQVTSPAGTGWAGVAAGADQTCAVRTDGTLWCWGDNTFGELGIGNGTNQSLPQQVTTPASTGWASVSGGDEHTCATRTDGTLWCWGANSNGQLGIGSFTTTTFDLPQQVTSPASTGWTSVAAGFAHTCATRSGASLWCWGWNSYGQLGIGNTTDQGSPQQVTAPASTGWTTVAIGPDGFHTCATRTHTLWCWGANFGGQLGIGNTTDQSLPQQVEQPSRTGWSLIALGEQHSCATQPGHALWCWGFNRWGQLGIGNFVQQDLPQQVTA
jgi:alpha-tubulin suppressor-like RCC1 family protein